MTGNGNVSEKVRSRRHKVDLPIAFTRDEESVAIGKTLDMSSTGIAFESDVVHPIGSQIIFIIGIELEEQSITLKCNAEITRVEEKDSKHLIAARVLESTITK